MRSDVSPPLRTLQPKQGQTNSAHPARRFGKTLDELRLDPHDRGRQAVDAPGAAPIPGSQWEGVSNVNAVVPPDTNGDVGPRDYVQWVNLSFQVFSKNGTSRYGPVPGNTLWQGFGGVCEGSNEGDPVAIYDRGADRWVMSQFAFAVKGGHDAPPYFECVAVSQTGDPTGAYNRYAFQLTGATNNFPDYPKFGVWNDAYYVTTNNFGNSFVGPGIYALDRTKMLAGDSSAGFVGQQLGPQYGGLLPAHRDGPTAPPAGAPGYFAGVDTNTGTSGSTLQLWTMHPNFANPPATTVSGPTLIPVTPYTFGFCGSAAPDGCIPQQGTTMTLDPLADRLMNRLEYRNFGDHESLVLSHTVNAGSNQAGERWYELRNIASAPSVYQSGTYAPADGVSRWMGSAAMDGYGDIALGYSASGSSLRPSIRYTGRLAGDTLGLMTAGEQTIATGAGSQTGYERWGDYSSMSVDPVDDATFWYTQEYYTANSSAGWHTRIASFKLVSTPNVALNSPSDGGASTGTPALSGTASGGTGDVTIKIYSGGSTSGALLQTLTATPSGGNWSASAAALPEGTYTAQAQQSDGSGHVGYSRVSTFRVDATAPAVAVTAPPNGSLINDPTPTISGTAGTSAGDLSGVTVKIHNGPSVSDPVVTPTLSTTRSAAGTWSVTQSAALVDGQHAVEAQQSDSAGNVGTSPARVFTVDATPPALTLTSPAPNSTTSTNTPAFGGAAGHAPGDLTVTVRLFSGTNTSVTPLQTPPASIDSGTNTWSATPTALNDGTYTVQIRQSDSATNTTTRQATFTVDTPAGPNSPPTASFGFSPASPLTGALLAFDGSGSSDSDGSINSWAWTFGDGGGGSGVTTSHAYSAAGAYTAQLTVTDNRGATASTTREVTVTAPPPAPRVDQPALPAGTPTQPAQPAALAPRLSLRLARQALGRVLRRGLTVVVSSNQDGPVKLELVISRRVARSLHLGRKRTIARLSRDLDAGDPVRVVLPLARAARTHIAGHSRLRATLRMTLGPSTLEQPVTLRR